MGYNITMSAPSRRQPSAAAAHSWGTGLCMRSQPSKVRHFVSYASNTWQIDVYEGLLEGVVFSHPIAELRRAGTISAKDASGRSTAAPNKAWQISANRADASSIR
jgi:hypothetical protein